MRHDDRLTDKIIGAATFRKNVYKLIPDGATRILDLGCGSGSLLLRLKRDKGCRELYAIETNPALTRGLKTLVDGVWHINIENHNQNIDPAFAGFFNHIILHDVVEHFYDPWYALPKLRPFLAPEGRLVIATPNFQHWDFLYKILSGDFPYGPGLWHTGHLRWYTLRSLLELVTLSGYSIQDIFLEIPYEVDLAAVAAAPEIREVELPPKEVRAGFPDLPVLKVGYPRDVKAAYPAFLAHKLLFVCAARPNVAVTPTPMVYDCPRLEAMRQSLDNPFDVYNPPPFTALVGDWN